MSRGAVACNGGNWDNGANAGLFYLNVNNEPANDNTNIGARLANENGQMPFGSRAGGQNLYYAYSQARAGKRYTPEALQFARHAESHIARIRASLLDETWTPGEPRRFQVYDPKWREIVAPPFADRVVHHAIVQVIEPLFERRFIRDSYACRVGKGTHAAVARVQRFLRIAKRNWDERCYVVKVDVSKYFASINHDIAIGAVERVIDDPWLLRLLSRVLRGYGFACGTGIPVGALTSQLLANVVLDVIDHRVKDIWGERFFVRYMDDMILLVPDKASAQYRIDDIRNALDGLLLKPNPKSAVFPWQRGIDFCGYRIWPTHILPRKRTMKRWRRKLHALSAAAHAGNATRLDFRDAVMSAIAYSKHASTYRSLSKILWECPI